MALANLRYINALNNNNNNNLYNVITGDLEPIFLLLLSLTSAGESEDSRHGYIVLSICSFELRIIFDILSHSQSGSVCEIFPHIRVTASCQTSRVEHQVGCHGV